MTENKFKYYPQIQPQPTHEDGRKLTSVTFYQNTPFTDFSNTMQFKSNQERDDFMDSHYVQHTVDVGFNMTRDRQVMRVPADKLSWGYLSNVNFISFVDEFSGDKVRYYAQVLLSRYDNNGVTEIDFAIDPLFTFCQGDIAHYASNVQIDRQHLTKATYNNNLTYLRNNQDTIVNGTLKFISSDYFAMNDMTVVFRSSVDLTKDFGTTDAPKMTTSKGQTYDNVVSPQDLYECSYSDFTEMMGKIQGFPWIVQNITNVMIIPKVLIDNASLEDVKDSFKFGKLKKFKDKSYTADLGKTAALNRSNQDLLNTFGINDGEQHLMRDSYCNAEMKNWQGKVVPINLGKLSMATGMQIYGQCIAGYSNLIAFYVKDYNSAGDPGVSGHFPGGSYLDSALVFNEFDSSTLMINNDDLWKANTAYQRQYDQSNQISAQAKGAIAPDTSLKDRLGDAYNVIGGASNLVNPMGLADHVASRLNDEWQFYRKQQAEFNQHKIDAPTVGDLTTKNSFTVKEQSFGVTVKYSRIDDPSMDAVRAYHANFGFDWNRTEGLESTQSMKYCNFCKFHGNWIMPDRNIPQSIMAQIRIIFQNGVRLWHNPERVDYPYNQLIYAINTMVK